MNNHIFTPCLARPEAGNPYFNTIANTMLTSESDCGDKNAFWTQVPQVRRQRQQGRGCRKNRG